MGQRPGEFEQFLEEYEGSKAPAQRRTSAAATSRGQAGLFQSRSVRSRIPPAHRRFDRRDLGALSTKQTEPDVLVSLLARPAPGLRRTHQAAAPGRNFARRRES